MPVSGCITAVADAVEAGVGYLADLVARIVNRIAGLAPLALLACSGPKVEPAVEDKPAAVAPAPPVDRADDPRPLGKFDITFYYVVGEEEVEKAAARRAAKAANDNVAVAGEQAAGEEAAGEEAAGDEAAGDEAAEVELAATVGAPEMVTIYEPKACAPIAEVTADFAQQLLLQGTGKLRDGRVVNIWGACPCERKPCFKVTPNKWGTAGNGRPLQPFRTVAVDRTVVKMGSLLYVPLLEGRTMPGRPPWGGFVHDGCVVADDTGGGINGKQLDLFVGRRGYFLGMSGRGGSHAWARHVPVYDGTKHCVRNGRKIGRRAASI